MNLYSWILLFKSFFSNFVVSIDCIQIQGIDDFDELRPSGETHRTNADEFTSVSEIESRRNLRSASTASLVVPRFQRKTLGGRAFPVAAAQAWSSLPSHVTSSSSLASFKRNLKTDMSWYDMIWYELFLRSYVQAWYRLVLHFNFLTLLRVQVSLKSTLIYVTLIIFVIYYYYYYFYYPGTSFPGDMKISHEIKIS